MLTVTKEDNHAPWSIKDEKGIRIAWFMTEIDARRYVRLHWVYQGLKDNFASLWDPNEYVNPPDLEHYLRTEIVEAEGLL